MLIAFIVAVSVTACDPSGPPPFHDGLSPHPVRCPDQRQPLHHAYSLLSESGDGSGNGRGRGGHRGGAGLVQVCGQGQRLNAYEAMSAIAHAVCASVVNGVPGYVKNGYPDYATCHSSTLHAECPIDWPSNTQACGRYLCGNHPTRGSEFKRLALCINDGMKRQTFGPACFTLPQAERSYSKGFVLSRQF